MTHHADGLVDVVQLASRQYGVDGPVGSWVERDEQMMGGACHRHEDIVVFLDRIESDLMPHRNDFHRLRFERLAVSKHTVAKF